MAAQKNGSQPADGGDGQQSGSGKEGSGKAQGAADKPDPTGQLATPSGSNASGSGGFASGDGSSPPVGAPAPGEVPQKETEWGEQDLSHARNAANLALEHLRAAVDSGRDDVLAQLGWTPEQARAFLARWESLRRMAESGDPVQRGEFERAMHSLGLRPSGVRSSRDVPSDVKGGQAEGRRSRPPSDYREQLKAYTQGTAGE